MDQQQGLSIGSPYTLESSVPSAKEEGEEPAMEMVSSTSHSSHVPFPQVSVGSEQGPWDPEVPSSPTACGGCGQALAWSRLPALLGARPLVSPGGTCSCQKEQILLCRSSLVLKARSPAHLPGTGTPSTGPALDVSHPSISRKCSPALSWAVEWGVRGALLSQPHRKALPWHLLRSLDC